MCADPEVSTLLRSFFFSRTVTAPLSKSKSSRRDRIISDRLAPVYAQKANIGWTKAKCFTRPRMRLPAALT